MKQLLLMRHAKSSWSNPGLADHDRPLNKRGNRNAVSMGEFLDDNDCVPNSIVSSTARRAADTATILVDHCDFQGDLTFDRRLYHAAPREFGYVVTEVDDSIKRLMLVSHNPGLEEYLYHLTGAYESMPTAAIAVIEFEDTPWLATQRTRKGELVVVWRPKEVL